MKLFFKKEEKSIKELIKEFKETKKPISCKYIHNHNCIISSIEFGARGALIFTKLYFVFFLIKVIRNFKKYNTIYKILIKAFRTLKSPILYSFFFIFFFKTFNCFIKKHRFFIKPYFNIFFCFAICNSIGFETVKRQADFSAYSFGYTLFSVVNHFIDKYFKGKKEKEFCSDYFNKVLYCVTFGLLVHCLNFEDKFLGKSVLRHFKRLFPSVN